MFPTYSKIVEVVFSQIIANNMFEKLDNAAELRIHAQVTHVLPLRCIQVLRISLSYSVLMLS